MRNMADISDRTQLDFRSQRFRAYANALARMTACPLGACRQELFIAEGDAAEAYQVLLEKACAAAPWVDAH